MEACMKSQEYLDKLLQSFQAYFDIYTPHFMNNRSLLSYARSHYRGEKYVLHKKLQLWAVENNEHCLFYYMPQVNTNTLEDFKYYLQQCIPLLVKPHHEHMSSTITGVILSGESFSNTVKASLKRYRYTCYFKWGFHGWCDIRLIGVDLAGKAVITNPKGKEVQKLYLSPFDGISKNINHVGKVEMR